MLRKRPGCVRGSDERVDKLPHLGFAKDICGCSRVNRPHRCAGSRSRVTRLPQTYEAAETAGRGIKKHYPILQVAVYDGVESVNKIIETRHAVEMTAQITRIRSRAARIDIRAKLLQKVVLSEAGLDAGSPRGSRRQPIASLATHRLADRREGQFVTEGVLGRALDQPADY
jgi:hypothetical protein